MFCQRTSRATVWLVAVMPAGRISCSTLTDSGAESGPTWKIPCFEDVSLLEVDGLLHGVMPISVVRPCCTNFTSSVLQ